MTGVVCDRSCWRAVSAAALDGSPPDGQRQSGPALPLWGSPPPAAYLRSAHSPAIEELVAAGATDTITL